jgi:hypothetical protein
VCRRRGVLVVGDVCRRGGVLVRMHFSL